MFLCGVPRKQTKGVWAARSVTWPELSREGDAFAEEIDQFFVQAQTILSTRLKRAQQERELSSQAQPKEIARFLLMASQGALLLAKTRNSLAPLREAEKMVLQFLGSLAPEKKRKA